MCGQSVRAKNGDILEQLGWVRKAFSAWGVYILSQTPVKPPPYVVTLFILLLPHSQVIFHPQALMVPSAVLSDSTWNNTETLVTVKGFNPECFPTNSRGRHSRHTEVDWDMVLLWPVKSGKSLWNTYWNVTWSAKTEDETGPPTLGDTDSNE